jgi:hypothetical protein
MTALFAPWDGSAEGRMSVEGHDLPSCPIGPNDRLVGRERPMVRDPNGHPGASSHVMPGGGKSRVEAVRKHGNRRSEPDSDATKHRDGRGQRDEPRIGGVRHPRKRGFGHIAENPEGRVIVVEQVLNDGEQLDVLGDLIG